MDNIHAALSYNEHTKTYYFELWRDSDADDDEENGEFLGRIAIPDDIPWMKRWLSHLHRIGNTPLTPELRESMEILYWGVVENAPTSCADDLASCIIL